MTDAERRLLLIVAHFLAEQYPDRPFGSNEVSELHRTIKEVKEEEHDGS